MAECRGKHGYPSMRVAEQAVFAVWAKDPTLKVGDLHAYKCPRCHKYHVGHVEYYEKSKDKQKETGRESSADS